MFDNGAVPKVHPQSRAIVLAINPQAKTDTLLADYEHSSPELSSGSQGSVADAPGRRHVRRLGRGAVLLGIRRRWAAAVRRALARLLPVIPRVSIPLDGDTREPPAGRGERADAKAPVTVYASWNGATEVTSWRVLAGPTPTRLTPAASAAKNGFETALLTPGPESYVAVQALNSAGAVLGTSKTIRG